MKRKVIQLAHSTAVISLPSKWVKKYGIKKGDEIDVSEEENQLVVQAEQIGSPKKQEIEVNLSGVSHRVLMWTLVAVYRAGYDRIRILYDDTLQFEQFHRFVSQLLEGFQVTQEGEGYCVIEGVSKERETDFQSLFKKSLRLISAVGNASLENIKNGEIKKLQDVLVLEEINNRLTILCERMLTKGGCVAPSVRPYYYIVAWHSQKMCNFYRDICRYLIEKPKAKLTKKLLDLYTYTNQVMARYEEQYVHTDAVRLVELYQETRLKISEIDFAQFSKEEQPVLLNLVSILNRAADISTVLIGIHEVEHQKAAI
ncbi:MAG: AbrB/MazE/SpoVT family DNA-binding domain-containing protein [Nanoarchaeota archaeon]